MEKEKIKELIEEFIYGKDGLGNCVYVNNAVGYIIDGRLHYLNNSELKSLYKDKVIKTGTWIKQYGIVEYDTLLLVMTDVGLVVQNITLNKSHDANTLTVKVGDSSLLEVEPERIKRSWFYAKTVGNKFEYTTYKELPIFLINREDYVDYDEYESILVVCKNEDEARKVMLAYSGFDRNTKVTIKEIGKSNLEVECPVIPIASFNAS